MTAAVLGTLIFGYLLAWIARRQQRAQDDGTIRHDLVSQMTLTANELHFAIVHYIRVRDNRLGEGVTLKEMAPILHEQYRKTRTTGFVLDGRLEAFLVSAAPREHWHAAMDLLAVRYYAAIRQTSENLLKSNAGPDHSGVSLEDLKKLVDDDSKLTAEFRHRLGRAYEEVLESPIRR
ncbi:hypothetical protein [Arthrobacter sp. B3I9]|uniref:hypothetical protein n=1 Tax=Arthrobacter sp. B3I9 TaxID=3042270 RepID=UPI0027D8E40C|nr:hypothetical protein [Arthrobacter sp. B3I9]